MGWTEQYDVIEKELARKEVELQSSRFVGSCVMMLLAENLFHVVLLSVEVVNTVVC